MFKKTMMCSQKVFLLFLTGQFYVLCPNYKISFMALKLNKNLL